MPSKLAFVWLIVGALLLISDIPASACDCFCYYSSDCPTGAWCSYTGCIKKTVDGKLKDGICKSSFRFPTVDLFNAGEALSLWLQAYEVAGFQSGGTIGGGGPPDPDLVADALSVPLSPEQHEDIRFLAIDIQGAYLGFTVNPDLLPHQVGFFSPPVVAIAAPCGGPFRPFDNGSVLFLSPTLRGVGAVIREAVVGELRNPGEGVLEANMARIPVEFPDYRTFGRCEFPHPPEHGHAFPFPDGIACLTEELRRAVASIQPPQVGSAPALTGREMAFSVILVLIAGTLGILRQKRRSRAKPA